MPQGKQLYLAAVSAVFLLFLLAPLSVFLIGPRQEVSAVEKRKLAVFPKVERSLASGSLFPQQFDTYYNDHFGFRDGLIRLYNGFSLKFFRVSPSNFVLQGKDDWFFYTGESVLEDYVGQRLVSQVLLSKHAATLSDRRDWLAGLGVRYLFVPIPNKISIYDEYVPYRVRRNRGETFYEQFVPFLYNEADFHEVVDLYSFFLNKKPEQQLYFKTDTHWSNDGALLAFNRMMTVIADWFPNRIKPITEAEISYTETAFFGDLSMLMHMEKVVEEEVPVISIRESCVAGKANFPPASLKELQTLVSDDHRRYPMENGCPQQELTALVIHDSFGRFLHRYFNERFKRVIYSPYIKFNELEELIAIEQPDIVIEVWVARNLGKALTPDPSLEAALLAEQYEAAYNIALRVDSSLNLNSVLVPNDVHLENHDDGIFIQASGKDPFFALPFLPEKNSAAKRVRYLVEVELDAPAETMFALYFTVGDNQEHIVPHQVVEQRVNKGRNRLLFRLPHSDVRGLIRIDIGRQAGEYLLRSLTIKAVTGGEKIDVSE